MATSRESKEIEKVYDRFLQYTRNFDKILWSYCSKNIEKEEYPMSHFSWISEEFDDLKFMFNLLGNEMEKENQLALKLQREKNDKDKDSVDSKIQSQLEKAIEHAKTAI